jgi:hypothetical protein
VSDDAAFATVNGSRATRVHLFVGNKGPWYADVDFEDAPDLSGHVTIKLGELSLQGTIVPAQDGTFGGSRRSRIVAGGGGWGDELAAKGYHNDAGIKAELVAQDAAREAGEVIGGFVPFAERIGIDYARQAGTASKALEDAIGDVPWWVDYNGITQVGARPAVTLASADYQLVAYDPRARIATLSIDDPSIIVPGVVLSDRLDIPQTIREFELVVGGEGDGLRVTAWMGGDVSEEGRLAQLMRSIILRATDGCVHGVFRYRVIRMAADGRVELQAIRKVVGLPDLLPVSQWPGVAGVHAELTPGATVLVQFVDGDRTQPIITGYEGKNGAGFVPVSLFVGGSTGEPAARSGDAVEVLLPPAVFSGSIGGAPASGVLTFPIGKTSGTITAGSSKVKVAT